jgi:glycosyltransferase involved in cell wall biosynthesis
MRLKLLFVIGNLQFGGGERVFAQIINGLPPEKYHIFLASQPSEQFRQAIHRPQIQFLPIDFSKTLNFSLIPSLSEIIKKNEIEIVHGQGARAEFYARLANRFAGKSKYVSTVAMPVEGFDVNPLKKKIYSFSDRFSESFVDRFLVVSDVLREKMIRGHGIPAEKVVRIYNGVEINYFSPTKKNGEMIRKEFKVGKETLLIGSVGRLVWQKGFEHLVQAIPKVLNEFDGAKVLIVGEGPLRNELEALAERLKVKEHLVFAGFRTEIDEILSAIDILVIPSLLEGFPMITLEGMAMAKPIIATKIEGIREQIVDGNSGILVSPKDSDAISRAIVRLTKEIEFAKQLGLGARRRVEKEFSVEKMVAETERVYLSLLGIH